MQSPSKHYEVRFTCYQYNSGAADNGWYPCKKVFQDIEEAKRFAKRVWAGFVERFDGIFCIIQEQIC